MPTVIGRAELAIYALVSVLRMGAGALRSRESLILKAAARRTPTPPSADATPRPKKQTNNKTKSAAYFLGVLTTRGVEFCGRLQAHHVAVPGLRPGWLFGGRQQDLSDVQWREFRASLPLLAAIMAAFVALSRAVQAAAPARRAQFYVAFAAVFLAALHGTAALFVLALALASYALTRALAGRPYGCGFFVCSAACVHGSVCTCPAGSVLTTTLLPVIGAPFANPSLLAHNDNDNNHTPKQQPGAAVGVALRRLCARAAARRLPLGRALRPVARAARPPPRPAALAHPLQPRRAARAELRRRPALGAHRAAAAPAAAARHAAVAALGPARELLFFVVVFVLCGWCGFFGRVWAARSPVPPPPAHKKTPSPPL
jgi:hypothetical protein